MHSCMPRPGPYQQGHPCPWRRAGARPSPLRAEEAARCEALLPEEERVALPDAPKADVELKAMWPEAMRWLLLSVGHKSKPVLAWLVDGAQPLVVVAPQCNHLPAAL